MSLHPSIAAVRRGVRSALAECEPGETVVVAVSGGADSMALASAAIFEGAKKSLRVIGATVDHGLQVGSDEVAAVVAERLSAMGISATATIKVAVDDLDRVGPEGAARNARYAALDQYADHVEARLTLLGHTRDDQAETVLLGLARGSGGRSIAGMRRAFGRYRRPILDVGRDDTITACQVEGITVWEDPHNVDPGYARVRVRRAVLPVLEDQLGPGIAKALARTADQLRSDMAFLDDVAALEWSGTLAGELPVAALAEYPIAIRSRVLRLAAVDAGAIDTELTYDHVMALNELIENWHGQKWIDLPGHIRAVRRGSLVTFEPGA